jgi:hypothetical protein
MPEQSRPLGDGLFRLNVAARADDVRALQAAWKAVGQESEVPTAQPEWTLAAVTVDRKVAIRAIYAVDSGGIQAVLPLVIPRGGSHEPCTMPGPASEMPVDVAFRSPAALQHCLLHAMKSRRPVVLGNMLASSPAVAVIRELAGGEGQEGIEPTTPVRSLAIESFPLPDRSQSAARASIMAASFGFSGGPADVLFQYVAPTAQQVDWLSAEVLDINGAATGDEGQDDGFYRQHAMECAREGEMRFSCLRMGGRLLAGQVIQCRGTTAWVLRMRHLACFRGEAMDALLMQETIRQLQKDQIRQIVLPRVEGLPELAAMGEVARVRVTLRQGRSLGRIFSRAGRALFGRTGIL